jgi:hypothetical protein
MKAKKPTIKRSSKQLLCKMIRQLLTSCPNTIIGF